LSRAVEARRRSKDLSMPRIAPKSGAPSHRSERVAEQIRHALAEIFSRGEVVDPVLNRQVVTIANVRMSPDLKLAVVAFLPLGGGETRETLEALQQNKKALRARVAQRVNLKYAPDLRFVVDESFDVQSRMDELLRSPRVARDLEAAPDEETK
jgi:ribosome-binding factor A